MKIKRGSKFRKPGYPVDRIFLDRWSSRAMCGKKISEKELMSLFEAARWAPSAFNEQPWRFIYSIKGTKEWKKMLGTLGEKNQIWCKNSAALVCLISKKNFSHNGNPNRNHLSDAGAAWENLALQGCSKGFVIHGMAGFNFEKARKELKIPKDYDIVQMIAIGKCGNPKDLPEEMQKLENPNNRKSLKEIVFKGKFKN